jgi:hypothetical protein
MIRWKMNGELKEFRRKWSWTNRGGLRKRREEDRQYPGRDTNRASLDYESRGLLLDQPVRFSPQKLARQAHDFVNDGVKLWITIRWYAVRNEF